MTEANPEGRAPDATDAAGAASAAPSPGDPAPPTPPTGPPDSRQAEEGDPPARPPGSWRRFAVPIAIFAAAFAVRLAIAIEAWISLPFLKSPVVDGMEYFKRAREVVGGNFWPVKMEIHPPGYGWFVGLVFSMFGDAPFALYVVQALVGAGTAVLLWRLTCVLAGPRPALVAGALAAVAWPAVFQEIYVSAAGPALFLAAAALNLAAWAREGKPARALAPGFAVGLAGITHGMMLAFGLVLLLPLLDRTRRGLAAAGLGAAAAVLPILLVAAHNRTLDDGAFSLQANVGLNVWIGNNPSADGTPNVPQGPAYEQIIHDAWREGHLTAGEQDRYFRNKALSWAASHPLAWLALAGRKALATLSDAEFDSSMDAGIFREGLSLDVLAFVRWGWLAALAVPGGALIWRRSKDRQVWLAGLVAAALPLLVLLTSNRYRVPLLAAMVPAAAVALEAAWTERRALRAPGAQALAWLALGTGAVSHLNLLRLDGSTIFDRDRAFGASLAARGDLSAAEQRFLASRAAHPEDPHIHLLLGRLYAAAGDSASARSAVREALRMRPHYHDALVLAAMVTPAASEVQDHFRRALDADPRDPRLHGRYGEWLLASDRFADAIPPLESAVALQPRSRSFRANLALALYGAGRKSDAETHFRKILEADPDHAEALFGVAAIAFERGDRDECLRFARRAAAAGHARAAALVQRASQP